jgi:hypothetical protein
MSFLRVLSPRPAKVSSRSSPITLALHVPSYGAIRLNGNSDPFSELDPNDPHAPRDVPLTGELEVNVPEDLGRQRCKAIRVGVRTVVRLDMGPRRKGEEDTIFERKVEIIAGNAEGIWLESGRQPLVKSDILR